VILDMTKIPSHLQTYLQEAMAGLRAEAMELFARELMVALRKDGWQFDEFLGGLADYASARSDWQAVAKHLEDASAEVCNVRREIVGDKK
jgi:hypothetical protein